MVLPGHPQPSVLFELTVKINSKCAVSFGGPDDNFFLLYVLKIPEEFKKYH